MQLPILYSFRRCPYAMRARMALLLAGIQVELREVVLRDRPAHMMEISPKGTVPVLLLPNGDVIEESMDIMLWSLDESFLTGDWEDLVNGNDGQFKHHLMFVCSNPEIGCLSFITKSRTCSIGFHIHKMMFQFVWVLTYH